MRREMKEAGFSEEVASEIDKELARLAKEEYEAFSKRKTGVECAFEVSSSAFGRNDDGSR